MTTLKKMAIGLAMVTVLAGSSMAGQLETGGNVPLINSMVGVGVLSLDFSGPGNLVNIATFMVSCNDASFDVAWTFTNKGNFMTSSGTQTVAMTDLAIQEGLASGSGGFIAGGGLARLFDVATQADHILTAAQVTANADAAVTGNAQTAGTVTWTETAQTSATVNDEIFMKASWVSANTALYGLYTEQIVYSVTAN